MLQLCITLVVFIVLILGIRRKIELKTLLLSETVLILLIQTLIGGSVLGDNTSGNALMDIIGYITNYLTSNIGGVVLSMIIVSAYVAVMNHINATAKLAELISIPMKKLNNPMIVLVLVIVFTGLLRTCITSGPACVLLVMATFYPVLIGCGCSTLTACAAILIANSLCWGPADPIDLAAAGLMGIEVNSASWFVSYQLIIFAVYFTVMAITYIVMTIVSKEKNEQITEERGAEKNKTEVPVIYALLPALPLIIMLVFSPFLISSITVDINIACFLSLLITLIVVGIMKKDVSVLPQMIQVFFDSFGGVLKSLGMPVLLAMVFASSLNMLGGMKVIANAIMQLSISPLFLLLLLCAFAGIINVVVGSFIGALSIAEPLAATIAAAAGIDSPLVCFLVILACGAGCVCSPVNPMVMILSEKVPSMQLIKKAAPAAWLGMIVTVIVSYFVFL